MIYTVKNEYLSVSVDSCGGCMTSLIYLPTGEERLWQGGEAWKSRDVVIFPVIGHAGNYEALGKTYSPKSHGVARHAEFALADVASDRITLALSANDVTRETYPYDFDFAITYKLSQKTLEITYFVRSQKGVIPFYVGGHPGMKAPGGEAYIEFENVENPLMYPVGEGRAVALDNIKSFVANKAFFAECKTLQLGSLTGGAIYATTGDGYRYTYLSDCPLWAFWSNEESGDYVCVEPWWGINDYPAAPREITLKPFMNFADEMGKSFSYSLTVEKI